MRKSFVLPATAALFLCFAATSGAETRPAPAKGGMADCPMGHGKMGEHMEIMAETAAILKEVAKDPAVKARAEALEKKVQAHIEKCKEMPCMTGDHKMGDHKMGGKEMKPGKDCPPGKPCPPTPTCPHDQKPGAGPKKP